MMQKLKKRVIWILGQIVRRISPVLTNRINYLRLFKRPMNTKNPKTFAEKLILQIESKEYKKYTNYADKWKVQEYVSEVIGKEFLIPVLAVYDSPEEIKYDQIPDGTYLKLNHGSGLNVVYNRRDQKEIHKKIQKWYKEDYYKRGYEQQYRDIERKILVQKNIKPDSASLWDYCFFTFQGKVEFVQIRDNLGHQYEVGENYEKLPYKLASNITKIEKEVPEFKKMVILAEKLAAPFNFVRVDFFWVDHRIYFGELTFSPTGGRLRFSPDEYNLIFGEKLG